MSPPDDVARAVAQIHAAPHRLVYAFAGAGSLALYWLHAVAGSSRTVLEARDCYAPGALAELVVGVPARAVSPAVARAMAVWAEARARALAEDSWPLLGVGCTAAIATDRERRGADQACVAVWGAAEPRTYWLTMARGARDRLAQEELVSRLVILALARACGAEGPPLGLGAGEEVRLL
jgi:nicotinamide mononucleotide (NMN) deamidase PncC